VSGTARLAAWLGFIGLLIAAQYGLRASSGAPEQDALYHYSTAVGGVVDYAFVLSIVLAIAAGAWGLLSLRRPSAWGRALRLAAGAFVFIYVATAVLDHWLHAGKEQGLTPSHWEPAHAGAYAANFVVIAVVAPIVEEITYRGVGFSLLQRFGEWTAIVVTALLFGLSHGLVEGLPVLTVFGLGIAWLRARTGSVYPGMLVHGTFNGLALVLAVTT
jgi:membrane protease YdiL (CAAX protease family)